MRVLVGGDFAPKVRLNTESKNGNFSALQSLRCLTEKSDLSIVNLESPFIKPVDKPIEKYGPNLGCDASNIHILTEAGINMVTLANNHIMDYGASALKYTIEMCHKNGITTVGAADNLSVASKPLIFEANGEKVGIINCCEHEFSIATETLPGANPLDPIAQYNTIQNLRTKIDFILVIVHGGHEHFQLPSPRMKKTYRFFIDAGADIVINHHQHCYSGYEEYKGKYIFYGLGNLCFEGRTGSNQSWFEGYLVDIDFKKDKNHKFIIHPYLQFKDEPSVKLLEPNAFDTELNRLNNIIRDDEQLNKEVQQYYESCASGTISILEPYYGKMLGLKSKGFLPSLLSKLKKRQMTNFIFCESHLDKLRFALAKQLE